jgi:hypothetical protein
MINTMTRPYLLLFLLVAGALPAQELDRAGVDFFEAKIRPMLVKHCYRCHSAGAAAKKKLKAELYLDTRQGVLKGGESGPALVPGKPAESLLISALQHKDLKMPPKTRLNDELVAHFVKWVQMGGPDPRDGQVVEAAAGTDIKSGKKHWAFQSLAGGEPPAVKDAAWGKTPVDRFVRARQEAAGITPNPAADPRTLIRRVTFDLVGLPPGPGEVEDFVKKAATDLDGAYSALLDRLLASEHYGERWARHWLDIVRFAESNGYAFDGDRPNAWHFRDFVIKALNSDMPYDEFVRLQIAGDLLADTSSKTDDQADSAVRNLAATGFLVAGPYTTQQTQKERERSRYEQLDDIVSTIGTSLLGLTVGCARCHSHKFDPLPQRDYYRFISNFSDVGFANTEVNSNPGKYNKAKSEYDTVHAPLVAARTAYEKDKLPGNLDQWIAARKSRVGTDPDAGPPLKLSPWHHAGGFSAPDFKKAFDTAFPPEKGVDLAASYLAGKVQWVQQPSWNDGVVHNHFGPDNAANYIYRTIEAAEEKQVVLSFGSDDGIKVWLNGQEVRANQASRGAAADQELVPAKLKKGKNNLLVKIVNGSGTSGFYFRVMPGIGKDIEGAGNWHHVGPFQAANHDQAFATVFAPEKGVDFAQAYEDGKLKWTEQPGWKDSVAHNEELTGNNCANYLYRVVESETAQPVALNLGSDDGIKVWVNGREALAKKVGRNTAAAGQEKANIQLAAGRNEILVKISNAGGKSGFYFQATTMETPVELQGIADTEREKWNADQKKKLVEWFKGYDRQWLALQKQVALQEKKQPKAEKVSVFAARVRGTSYQFGEDTFKAYHLRRGNVDNKEELAVPGYLQVLMQTENQERHWLADPKAPEKQRAGRLGLIDWLTDSEKGAGHLLARVMVNRLWQHHFGRGIVATPSDFGTRGERPSHPLLLDWLAAELIRGGWRLKPIHKLIMSSAVYMQGNGSSDSVRKKDPENLLLWRRGARRLEAEIIRDTLLSVSGTLNPAMYGKGTLDQRNTRRSVYLTVKRSRLIPILQLFDAPDTMQGIATREESTVAPQALALLNSPIIRDAAAKFAAQVRAGDKVSLEESIDRAYRLAFSRSAASGERTEMTAFIQRQKESRGNDAKAAELAFRDFCHLVLCMNEFVYVD